jgi:carboxyl-terminal processing protease
MDVAASFQLAQLPSGKSLTCPHKDEPMHDPFYQPRRSPLTVYFALLLGLGLGILLDRSDLLPGSLGRDIPGLKPTFGEAWRIVEKHYVDRDRIHPERMTEGAIEGMLASLGDLGHTTYVTKQELQDLQRGLEGNLEGIGARISVRKGRPTIVQALPDSPAQKVGLRAGDVLSEVDGKTVANLSLDQIVQRVRGPAGSVVQLRILRGSDPKPLDLSVTRAKVEVPDVTWHILPGVPIAHVAIRSFGQNADEQLRQAVEEARQAGVKGLIVDVRANPGGLRDQAVAVTSEFLKAGEIVFIEQDAQGNRTEVPVKPGGIVPDIPLCVLIDEGTASSAEIFAGALQDYGRAKLVGTRTFGTGTVLRPFELSDGSAVILAVDEWYTPKGRQIWHKGIEPDVAVSLPTDAEFLMPWAEGNLDSESLQKSSDKQLLEALEVLRKQLS